MKNSWPTRFGLSVLLAGAVGFSGCSGVAPNLPANNVPPNAGPATAAYMFGHESSGILGILEYSISHDKGSPFGTLTLPPSTAISGQLAADQTGQVYIAASPANNEPVAYILIYPPNATGASIPSRTIELSGTIEAVFALAVDPAGQLLYVVTQEVYQGPETLNIYSATGSGLEMPLRTVPLANGASDIAADAAGNVYVAGWVNDGAAAAIAVYSPTVNGADMPARTITLGDASNTGVDGVAIDPVGDVFVTVCACADYPANYTIEEFAPGASGEAAAINTISLTAPSGRYISSVGPVRLDSAGNIFTSLGLPPNTSPDDLTYAIYVFEPTATGSQAPKVQIFPADAYSGSFALN